LTQGELSVHIQWLIDRRLDALERRLGVKGGIDYLRQMSRSSRALFFRFVKAAQLAGFHRQLPTYVFYVASLTATQRDGCGDCLQMGLNAARGEGVAEKLLEQLSLGREANLSGRLADVQCYTHAVLDGVDDA
jgi:alkylhydroperoxidase family enzyme